MIKSVLLCTRTHSHLVLGSFRINAKVPIQSSGLLVWHARCAIFKVVSLSGNLTLKRTCPVGNPKIFLISCTANAKTYSLCRFFSSSLRARLRVGEASSGYPASEGGSGRAQVTVAEGGWVAQQHQLTVGQVQQGHVWC